MATRRGADLDAPNIDCRKPTMDGRKNCPGDRAFNCDWKQGILYASCDSEHGDRRGGFAAGDSVERGARTRKQRGRGHRRRRHLGCVDR